MTEPTPVPLPPGRTGLPLLGETLAFLQDAFGFVRSRMAQHGPVFRTHLLGAHTAIMAGPEACALWLDPEVIERHKSMPFPVHELFGGDSLPLLDGEVHATRKQLVMAGFTREALAAYVPALDASVQRYFARQIAAGDEPLLPGLKALAIEGIGATVLGLAPGDELSALLADYGTLTRGFTGLPLNLPITAFGAAVRARDRLLALLLAQIKAHRESPRDDALSRMLAARVGEVALSDEEAALETHHIVLAGLIIFAEFAATLTALTEHPAVLEQLRAELAAHGAGAAVDHKLLSQLPYLARVVDEVKRTCPNVPVSFGKARREFTVYDKRIPAGWFVFLSVTENNRTALFAEPDHFDPDRFAPGRDERTKSPHAFVPQGPGPASGHRCAGQDFSSVFMQLFTLHLAREHSWTLAESRALRFGTIPPEAEGGLRGRLEKRA